MRIKITLLVSVLITVFFTARIAKSQPHNAGPESRNASVDSVLQYLLTSSASDFHTHGPAQHLHFRDVHFGHAAGPGGKIQYLLCGQFMPVQDKDQPVWVPFATIRTSGFEQYTGAQAASFCQNSSVTWEQEGDLTSLLQARYDSLR